MEKDKSFSCLFEVKKDKMKGGVVITMTSPRINKI